MDIFDLRNYVDKFMAGCTEISDEQVNRAVRDAYSNGDITERQYEDFMWELEELWDVNNARTAEKKSRMYEYEDY